MWRQFLTELLAIDVMAVLVKFFGRQHQMSRPTLAAQVLDVVIETASIDKKVNRIYKNSNIY
jgi:hypothetical protein